VHRSMNQHTERPIDRTVSCRWTTRWCCSSVMQVLTLSFVAGVTGDHLVFGLRR
jgi:hypothetical protein